MPIGGVTFVFDVDNTLLDNDDLLAKIDRDLRLRAGADTARRFWETYESVRTDRGVADMPRTLERLEATGRAGANVVTDVVGAISFQSYLFPGALDALRVSRKSGYVVVASDGDHRYQPQKIRKSGIEELADRVFIYDRKQDHMKEIIAAAPARQYILVDDKARVLAEMRRAADVKATTVHVRQGKYAQSPADAATADLSIASIAEFPLLVRQLLPESR